MAFTWRFVTQMKHGHYAWITFGASWPFS